MKLLKGLPINPAALKGIPAILRQPQWVAAIVSVGFHGALFAAGPSFSNMQGMALGAQGGTEAERRVPIIELTAEEQSRLPDFNSPAYSFLPGDLLPGEFPPSDFSGSNDSLMELFPPSGRSPSPVFPPLPGGLSTLPRIPSSSLGAPVTVSPFPSRLGRNNPIVIPNLPGNRPNLPVPRNLEDVPEPSEDTDASPTTRQTGERPSEPSAEDLLPRNGESAPEADDSAPLNARQEPSDSGPADAARDLIARVEHNPALTTAAEAETAFAAWNRSVTNQLGEAPALAEETFSMEVPYDLRICLQPEPTDGLLGFVLLPGEEADTVDISTTVLKSTGYPFLNQSAAQSLRGLAANSETPLAMGTLYRAVVKVLYDDDNCIATDTLLKQAENAAPDSAAPDSVESTPEDAPEE